MPVSFRFSRVEPLVDSKTGNVIRWVIGLKGQDMDDPSLSAYIDAEVPVPEDNLKTKDQWSEEEIRKFAMQYAMQEEYRELEDGTREYAKRNWFEQLRGMIEAKKGQPIRGTSVII